jgi:L-threonylcarbamoyladenylate synthase
MELSGLSPQLMSQVERAVGILKKGGIVAYPTDTVYGLGGDVFSVEAIKRIYKVKQRPENMPLSVLLADSSKLRDIAVVPDLAWCLIERFWPGGLTLVLPKRDTLPDIVTAGGNKIAVRVPAHDIPIRLIRGLGRPIVGTSANISGKPNPLTAEEVDAQLGKKVDLIIDGGRCPGGVESTVVDVTSEYPVILRAGIIPEAEISKACRKIRRR